MKLLEYVFYESLPYIYGALAVFAFTHHNDSKVAGLAAVVLAFCSYQIFTRRYNYRNYASKTRTPKYRI